MKSCKNTKENSMAKWIKVVGHVRVEWEEKKFWICLINLYDMLSWCEQWVNETNNCMERRRGPLVPLGQVSEKTKLKRGRRNFGMSYVNDEWIKYGRKLNNKGKHDNFVVGNFMNQIHVLREEEMTLLILCIAYGFSYEMEEKRRNSCFERRKGNEDNSKFI